jgi:beta-alanine--pyruvate transaminase
VVVSPDVYDTFMDAGGRKYNIEFPHGYTYSAHPVACAAALATLDVLQQLDAPQLVRSLAPHFEQAVHSLRGERHVVDIRNFGLAAGITLASLPDEPTRRPMEVALRCWEAGFYVRFGGDTLQLAPPFVSAPAQIDALVAAVRDALAVQP